MTRRAIITRIIEEQQKVVENIKASVQRYEHASDIDEDSTIDPEDLSRQAEMKDMQLRFETMLKEAKNDLKLIENNLENTHAEIEHGSIVETNENFLFVGIPVPKFEFNGKTVISFSEEAPVFKQIKGKKTGDSITFGNQTLTIEQIH